jgi:hypothetical protein
LFGVFLFAAMLVSLVPLLGGLVQMMALPLLSLGFMIAAQSALLNGPVTPRQFIEAAADRRHAAHGLAQAVCAVWCAGRGGAAECRRGVRPRLGPLAGTDRQGRPQRRRPEIDALLSEPGHVTFGTALALVLGAALSVPFWHAPALVHWGGQTAGQALFSSTLAVWRCKGAFAVYMLGWVGLILMFGLATALVLGLLGMAQLASLLGIPAGLVFSAVFYISLLFTFNDSFGNAAPDGEPPPAAAS